MARPRSFDDIKVLDAALGCFWGRGYKATSIRDLAGAMGISGPSLYNAFGDKRSLFLDALEHYCSTRTYPMLARIEREHTGADAVAAFFAKIVDRSVADRERRGCFLINSVLDVAPHDKAMAKVVAIHLDAIRGFLARNLGSAHAADDAVISADVDVAADHLLAVLLGVRVLARTQPNRQLLEGIVGSALRSVGISQRRPVALRSKPRAVAERRDAHLRGPRRREKKQA